MTICPDAYAFLLDREYPKIRAWVINDLPTETPGTAGPFVPADKDLIYEWVWHNEVNGKTHIDQSDQTEPQSEGIKPETPFLDFLQQYKQTLADLRKYHASGIPSLSKCDRPARY